ncbi:MAG TPA: Spy/CpxP family protein refolding chaperone [Caulobacteraceae bacterium]
MTARPLRMLLLASLALPFAFATASVAQDRPAPPPAGGEAQEPGMREHGMQGHGMMHDPAARAAMMARRVEHMASRLRDILQLRAEQEPALQAFLQSMKPPGDDQHMRKDSMGRDGGKDGDEAEHLTTPQRLDHMLAHMDEMRTHMVAHVEAVKRFYAQLSPAQQRAFDAIGPEIHGEHGMGHGHMGDHMEAPGMDDQMDGPEDGPPPRG